MTATGAAVVPGPGPGTSRDAPGALRGNRLVQATPPDAGELARVLAGAEFGDAAALLDLLVQQGLDALPLPGGGATLQRWQALATVAEHDLSLAKLYEGHTDALAIQDELGRPQPRGATDTWGVWTAESPQGRVTLEHHGAGRVLLHGTKCWCSGAADLDHGLLTAWTTEGSGPQLVRVEMRQPGIQIDASGWRSVGMAGSAGVDVRFDAVVADPVGGPGDYLARPGFWHGGAGIAACWYGGARALGVALRLALARMPAHALHPFRLAALGKVDLALQSTAAVLRGAAQWIDDHSLADACTVALRARLAAEQSARTVLDEAGRALGATAFCRDGRFARMAADLPVFVRQSHAERDFASLGEHLHAGGDGLWQL